MRRGRLALGLGGVAVVALVVLGPGPVLRRELTRRGTEALGTPVRVGRVSWNPFTGSWTAHAVRVDADHGPSAFRVRRIVATVWVSDLLRRRWIVRDLALVGARARLRRVASGWEPPLPARPTEPVEGSGDATPWPPITLVGGHARPVALRLETRDGPPSVLRLRRLALAGATLASGAIRANGVLRGRLDRGGIVLAASFRRDAGSERVRARLAATGVDIRRSLRLAPEPLAAPVIAGALDVRGTYEALLHRGHGHRRAAGRAAVRDLAVGEAGAPGGRAARASVDRIEVDLEARTLHVGHVALREPEAWLTREADAFRVPGLLEPGRPAASSAGPDWQIAWEGVQGAGGALHYADADRKLDVRLERADLGAGSASDAELPLALSGRLPGGGTVSARATVTREPIGIRGDVTLSGVALPPLVALTPAPLPLESGELDGQLAIDLGPGGSTASGTLTLADLKTGAPPGGRPEDVLACKTIRLRITRLGLDPPHAELDSAVVEWPYVLLDRGADGIFPLTVVPTAPPGTAAAASPSVRVRAFEVRGGRIDFRDTTLSPPYWRSLASLALTADGVRLPPAAVANVRASGLVDELSPLRVEGTIGTKTHLRADVERVALPPFNAYLAPVFEYLVSSGAVTAHSEITVDRSQLEVSNQVVLSRLGLGGGGDDDLVQREVGIPLTLAVALMKDYRGDIALDLPFGGDLTAPTFSLRSLVVQAFVRAVRGAVMAPLTALGRVFMHEGRIEHWTLEPIPFLPGGRELDEAGRERVAQVARVLRVHSELGVLVRGRVGESDVERLQAEQALATLGTGSADRRLRGVLEARIAGRPVPRLEAGEQQRLDVLVAGLPWPGEALRQLAADRASTVVAALVGEPDIAAARVRAGEAEAPVPGPLPSAPGATVDVSPA